MQIFVLRSAAQPAFAPPVGIHLFPVTAARHRAGTARVLLGGFPPLLRRSVLVLSAYATKKGRSLVPADQPVPTGNSQVHGERRFPRSSLLAK